ncbi:ubiquitin carboxyl-terminal hydrolase 1 isoform X1 [Oncorhynchus mykiss]|uniref:Ubiquitin carboxyl-terminal hydrolase n=1 Tax=Oncorhynchus mykiss TaxID=8022 RepID=A0A8C7P0K7_ONCMY|nr:ubiquitin carboxyl-terminal hydrolase 1 isoform X1 [Oncorhynchus mykiss]
MPGLQGDAAALGSPIKKSKLSLKFFQKKETKRALDFSEPQVEEPKPVRVEPEEPSSCDQVVPIPLPGPAPCPTSPICPSDKGEETLVPFVGLNNLGNTCYLNSILQVLYYCPGLRDGIKNLYSLSKTRDKQKEEAANSDEQTEGPEEAVPVHMELLGSFHSLITSVEQLQSSYLHNPDKYSDGELATPPRKLLNTLRQLNPMYEGYLQHDAQEVLQCILGYIQEASETIRKEQEDQDDVIEVKPGSSAPVGTNGASTEEQAQTSETSLDDDDGQTSGKRKSDTEAGNAKKKPKSVKSKNAAAVAANDGKPLTRSKRKSTGGITVAPKDKAEEEGEKKQEEEGEEESNVEGKGEVEVAPKEVEVKGKKRPKLCWPRHSGKQPSIFSKFMSMGRISCHTGGKTETAKPDQEETGPSQPQENDGGEHGRNPQEKVTEVPEEEKAKSEECLGVDMMEHLFQGCLVLRTRCLECECYTERREDFQDISVPVQEEEPCSPDSSSEVSPDPKPVLKTLKWAISQFASVERIVGEDKYFCETCHHYTEAERSLLFDKTPEVVTIHLKCFSANGLEMDPYGGLSKVNTPLQTPLKLSLEEWCTHPSATATGGQHYQLFAVVMHSGVTISSGHYTTYIRMMDLKDTKVRLPEGDEKQGEEDCGGKVPGPEPKEEVLDYDDGEVSFSLRGKAGQSGSVNANSTNTSKMGSKKASDGVGLLGGQRSLSSYDLGGNKQTTNPDKAACTGVESNTTRSSRRTSSAPGHSGSGGVKKEPGEGEEASVAGCEGFGVATEQALSSLLQYEGKWMLFDDSEVRLFEEEDFLRACSPETCSTSTPYLLFYRRV